MRSVTDAVILMASLLQAETPFGEPGAASSAAPLPCLAMAVRAIAARYGDDAPSLAVGGILSMRDQEQLAALGPSTIRVVAPGDMATMDHQPDRLTIDVDPHGRILRRRCG